MNESDINEKNSYLNDILKKFNDNPEDPSLDKVAYILLTQIREVQEKITELSAEISKINEEILERQKKGESIIQQITHKQGESQGYVNALLKLRK